MKRNNKYYYYPPINPQFFFPKKNFKIYHKLYVPFSTKSKVFWYLFQNSYLVRSLFKIKEGNIPLPISTIIKIIGLDNPNLFLNLGTRGIEQKATIIADDGNTKRFLKFAQNTVSKQLVANEAMILLKLEHQSILKIARVINFKDSPDYAFVLTEVISGQKSSFTKLNDKILKLLYDLGKIYPLKENEQKELFSHGDFCPWNMLVTTNQEIVLIDWEMAGFKPLGYDLFTFIFQTNFLLQPSKSVKTIFSENKHYIHQYFMKYNINEYIAYLNEFARLKICEEDKKENSMLLLKYQELLKQNGLH